MTSEPVGRHQGALPVLAESCLPRDRLVARVLATPPAGLCLISAPPGYGGTTVMALATAGQPNASRGCR